MEKDSQSPVTESDKNNRFYKIMPTVDYLTDHIQEVQGARERIWIQTMALESGHFTNLLTKHLIAATKCGVDVRIVYDAYSTFVTDNSFNHVPGLTKQQREQQRFARKSQLDMIRQLKEHCAVVQTNYPTGAFKYLPFRGVRGRDHKKISLVDDTVYIGGVNMAPLDAQRTDFMLKTNDYDLVDKLSLVFLQSFHGTPISDELFQCNENNRLLIDSGRRGRSIIMNKAYELISKEKNRIILISPFLPSGKLRNVINVAVERGVDVQVITSQKKLEGVTSRVSQAVHSFRQVSPKFKIFRYDGVVHAKALLLGDETAILGSHNFDELFVKLGTEEVSLLTTASEITSQLLDFAELMKRLSRIQT